ncbi:phosphatase PAP2 family protein [Sulfurisoma sediminicola]|uniref:Undecaprenyl-diphosphatase n=1 Tax=Sulfurisoma sediminicola TaxID=1381557 RepID=A0A497XLM1_9PROT|nr:phosphatase PAP2 family protein [Sulfurisoma sediminicola]RLJ68205.1 undecaprenyl-diphosphatase [Sulfurisoma sediminicola]
MIAWIEGIDAGLLGWLATQRTPLLDGFFAAVTWAGSLWLIAPASLALAWLAWRHGQRTAALLLGLGPLAASLASWALKLACDRTRPDTFPPLIPLPADASFPSGHTVQATAFALTLLLALHASGREVTVAMAAVALGYVALIGLSRLYLQVHYPSDVVAGMVVGVVGVVGVLAVHALIAPRSARLFQ